MLTNQFINQVPATGQVGFFGSHQMVVRKLLLQETGTYNAMYNRPYEVNSQGGMMNLYYLAAFAVAVIPSLIMLYFDTRR